MPGFLLIAEDAVANQTLSWSQHSLQAGGGKKVPVLQEQRVGEKEMDGVMRAHDRGDKPIQRIKEEPKFLQRPEK